jgi:transcriptional regulator with XRE-family HTH domain
MKTIHLEPYRHMLLMLTEQRTKAGITQQQLSQKMSRPQSYVSKYERGERRLDVVELLEICRYLDADPHEILRVLEASLPKGSHTYQ